ncbi:MAG: RNA polymerase sigma factor [Patescibacteria group bacterium]
MAKDHESAGAEALFDVVYDLHRRALYAYFLARTGESETAADLLQELFLRAWRHIGALRGLEAERVRYWLFAVAKNILADHYRRRAARPMTEEEMALAAEDPATLAETPEAKALAREELALLDGAIRRLPEDLRTILFLGTLGGMKSGEIGAALGKPAGSVRYGLHEARRRLAKEIGLLDGGMTR